MAVLQVLLAMIFRWLGTILNTLIGWASMLLFGKVPQNRQYILSVITLRPDFPITSKTQRSSRTAGVSSASGIS